MAAFPDSGFAFFGAYLGLLKAQNESGEVIYQKGAKMGWGFVFFGMFLMTFLGFPLISTDMIYPLGFFSFNLGLQVILASWLLSLDTLLPMHNSRLDRNVIRWSINPRRWSMISLTLFMFEQPISATFALIFRLLFGTAMDNVLFVILIFGPPYYYTMVRLIRRWEDKGFKYSIEWLLSSTGKENIDEIDIMGINDVVYLPNLREKDFDTKKVRLLSNEECAMREFNFAVGD